MVPLASGWPGVDTPYRAGDLGDVLVPEWAKEPRPACFLFAIFSFAPDNLVLLMGQRLILLVALMGVIKRVGG